MHIAVYVHVWLHMNFSWDSLQHENIPACVLLIALTAETRNIPMCKKMLAVDSGNNASLFL